MKFSLDHHTLKILEFQRIKDIFKTYAASEIGLSRIENLYPDITEDSVRRGLKETSEIKDVLLTVGQIPLQNIKEPGKIFKVLRKRNDVLEALQILDVADILIASRRIMGDSLALQYCFCGHTACGGSWPGWSSGPRCSSG